MSELISQMSSKKSFFRQRICGTVYEIEISEYSYIYMLHLQLESSPRLSKY